MPRAPAPSLFLFCSITVALIFTRHPPLSIRLSLSHLSNFDWTDFSPRPYTKSNRIVMRVVLVVPLSLIVFHDGVLRNGGSKLLHRREVFTHGASVLPMKSPENKQIKIIEKVDCVPSVSYEVGKSAPTLFHIYLADFGQLLTLNCSLRFSLWPHDRPAKRSLMMRVERTQVWLQAEYGLKKWEYGVKEWNMVLAWCKEVEYGVGIWSQGRIGLKEIGIWCKEVEYGVGIWCQGGIGLKEIGIMGVGIWSQGGIWLKEVGIGCKEVEYGVGIWSEGRIWSWNMESGWNRVLEYGVRVEYGLRKLE
ncbi:hypothetical protein B0H14DRAFT_2599011 [Mycena olivaceomarginata]|nr:hypothetical protein B0H14DRAFT_2599011 [Mycena olivaceomarginata]